MRDGPARLFLKREQGWLTQDRDHTSHGTGRRPMSPVTSPLRTELSLLKLPSKRWHLNAHGWDVSKYIWAANLLTLEMSLLVNIF